MWTFPLRTNSGPTCTTLSVQSVSVHLSHPAHFLSIGKYRWLSEFQNASVSQVVILAWEWSWKDQSIAIHPLYTLHSSKDFPGVAAVIVLCFSAFSSTVGLLPWRLCSEQATPFPLAKPPGHVCWFCFPDMPKLYRPDEGLTQGPFCLTPLHLSSSQHKSWDGCLYLSSIPVLANGTVL